MPQFGTIPLEVTGAWLHLALLLSTVTLKACNDNSPLVGVLAR